MKPAIQPMLVGVDAKNVTIRVSNTDLLQETPEALGQVFPSLINIATGALGGVVKPIALPVGRRLQPRRPEDPARADVAGRLRRPSTARSSPARRRRSSTGRIRTRRARFRRCASNAARRRGQGADGGTSCRPTSASASPASSPARPTVKLALGTIDNVGPRRRVRVARRQRHVARRGRSDANPVVRTTRSCCRGITDIDVRSRVVSDWSTESDAGVARRAHRLGAARAAPGARRRSTRASTSAASTSCRRRRQLRLRVERRRARSAATGRRRRRMTLRRGVGAHARRRAPARALRQGRGGQRRRRRRTTSARSSSTAARPAPSAGGCGC